jgi:hypothetical protein
VVASRKEDYLSDAEFEHAFAGIARASFGQLPKWKRDAAKRRAGLF